LELRSSYSPITGLALRTGLGRLTKSSLFRSNRWETQANLDIKHLPRVDYFVEFIDRDDRQLKQQSSWLRQRGRFEYGFHGIKPIFNYEGEIRKDAREDTSRTGFRFDSYTFGLELAPAKKLSASARYNVRDDKDRITGRFVPKSIARTQTYAWGLKGWHNITASASYTHRMRNFADPTVQDTRTDLADLRIRYTPRHGGVRSNLFYQISNSRVAKLEEAFIEVKEGEGNFRFNEERNEFEPDPFGNFVRRFFATNEFIPVVELKMRVGLTLSPAALLRGRGSKPRSRLTSLLSPLTTETFVRIDERSTEKDVEKIYLLHLGSFQQDSTTIFGSIEVRQDVYLWRNSRTFSLRYRFRNRRELNNQLVGGGQRRD
ncbi:MAG: hypothetical protein D6743_19090, partial [Calditrichaeota bacterium]